MESPDLQFKSVSVNLCLADSITEVSAPTSSSDSPSARPNPPPPPLPLVMAKFLEGPDAIEQGPEDRPQCSMVVVDEPPLSHEEYASVFINPQIPDHQRQYMFGEVCRVITEDYNYTVTHPEIYPCRSGLIAFSDTVIRDQMVRVGPSPVLPRAVLVELTDADSAVVPVADPEAVPVPPVSPVVVVSDMLVQVNEEVMVNTAWNTESVELESVVGVVVASDHAPPFGDSASARVPVVSAALAANSASASATVTSRGRGRGRKQQTPAVETVVCRSPRLHNDGYKHEELTDHTVRKKTASKSDATAVLQIEELQRIGVEDCQIPLEELSEDRLLQDREDHEDCEDCEV
ncbi:hypothetical protein ACQ4PT_029307 [Festuca glaucescens]